MIPIASVIDQWRDLGSIIKKRPKSYPLPLTHEGFAYWEISLLACQTVEGWREFNRGKPMADIIPAIDQMRAEIEAL